MESVTPIRFLQRCANALVGAVLALLLAMPAEARMYEEPKSFVLKDKVEDRVPREVLPKVDVARLLAEDRERGKELIRPGPQRFAISADVAYTLDNSGAWHDVPGGRVWRLRIHSPSAKSINLGITRFDMPDGAKLWIYDPMRKNVEGPYTAKHRSQRGSLWTPIIVGDEIVVEVFVPAGGAMPEIEITKVNRAYRGFEKAITGAGTEGTCENDVICPVGDPWRDQIRAVGAYTLNGTATCTGTMLNNTALDFTPYFLTANHCSINNVNDATVVVYWNYESANCGTHGPGSTADNQTGATFRAASAPSDFALIELNAKPDPAFNVFYAGWDASGVKPPMTVAIHHPAVDVKAISFSNSQPTINAYGNPVEDLTQNHWRAVWDSGVTEPGSSGSCLFGTGNKRCIGQLHGGPSFCGAAPSQLNDYYGRLSVSWTGGGTDATRLSNWLDPINSGALGMDGDPHITTADGQHYDFQGGGEYVALRDATGLEIQTRHLPISTSFTPGADPHDGLATCVSVNSAVAARVGGRRVTYQPNLGGQPDPSGMQLRIDGALIALASAPIDLGGGGRIDKTNAPGGMQITFPGGSVLLVTPSWWASQSKWYMNVDLVRGSGLDGIAGAAQSNAPGPSTGGLMGPIVAGSWLPALPDGSSMGPMPASLHQRYVDLYQKFGNAWRVTQANSLFDYAPGTSTATHTVASWPAESPPCVVPQAPVAQPVELQVAEAACAKVTDKRRRADCVFDVRVTGHKGFAETYLLAQQVRNGSTRMTIGDDVDPSQPGEWVTFTALVAPVLARTQAVPSGSVQFTLDGAKMGQPVKLDAGRATWETSRMKVGKHRIGATFLPVKDSPFHATSAETTHEVKRCMCEPAAGKPVR